MTLNALLEFGTPISKIKASRRVDPLQRMKKTFVAKAKAQIEISRAGSYENQRCWFTPSIEDGKRIYSASIRNGTRIMPLQGDIRYVSVESPERLQAFFERAIAMCENGELDQLLLHTMTKSKGGV